MNIKTIKELSDKFDELEQVAIKNAKLEDIVKISKKFLETKNLIMDIIVEYDKEIMGL